MSVYMERERLLTLDHVTALPILDYSLFKGNICELFLTYML